MNEDTYDNLSDIRRFLDDGDADRAVLALDKMIEREPKNDELLYLRGNAKRKKGDWGEAICDYLAAAAINPKSPAAEAADMLHDILEFRNKDLYNQ